ncbi:MAG: hypothetical protein JXB85_11580 [Anaerolineales bacterium]|nr:hypothetical protein [Anaerolineales bacterium]
MSKKKIDGVIEAVRYAVKGKIDQVRFYERRGFVWSDVILLERRELVEHLKQGRRYVVGQRELYRGAAFKTGKPIQLVNDGGRIVTDRTNEGGDFLAGVPVF